MTANFIQSNLSLISALIIALATIGAAARWIYKCVVKPLAHLLLVSQAIYRQFENNGGSMLRDRTDKIEESVSALQDDMKAVQASLEKINKKFDRIGDLPRGYVMTDEERKERHGAVRTPATRTRRKKT